MGPAIRSATPCGQQTDSILGVSHRMTASSRLVRFGLACAAALLMVLSSHPADAFGVVSRKRPPVRAAAMFTLAYGNQQAAFSFPQSRLTKSTLTGTPQVPISLHAASTQDVLQEFALAGRLRKGSQATSDAVALRIAVDVGSAAVSLGGTAGECTVTVTSLSSARISGSFSCYTVADGMPLTATGTFRAR